MSYAIVTDTSANLPTPLAEEHGIPVIPFSYFYGGKEYTCTDTEQFDGAEYFNLMRHGTLITTSQINPQRYVEVLRPLLAAGQDILFVGMSSGISGSFHCAELASEELLPDFPDRRIELVDTLGASLGEGIPVLKAAEFRQDGVSLEENAARLRELCRCMYQVFIVDDLMHLRRTGRLSSALAIVGSLLQIKPILKGNERGQIVNFAKVRGRRKAIEALAERYDTFVRNAPEQIVGIAHADCAADAEYLATLLRRNHPPKEILIVMYEPVTGSHVGPDTLALFFHGDKDVRSK